MGRCADCASYPWNVAFDPSTFTAIKCDERMKARRWTPASRDAENECEFFKNKHEVVKEEYKAEVVPEETPVQIAQPAQASKPVPEPKKRGGNRKGTR